jgi:hypothetical protein
MDDHGTEIKDVIEATTETDAADIIRSRNQYPIKVTPAMAVPLMTGDGLP